MKRPFGLGELLAAAAYNGFVLLMVAVLYVLLHERGPLVFLAVLVLGVLQSGFFVVVHELGHALAGWAVGFRVLHVNFSILELKNEFGRWSMGWCVPRRGLHGFVVAVPLRPDGLWWRDALLSAGGPLANLVAAALSLWLADQFKGQPVRGWPASLTLLWPAGIASGLCLLGFLTNLLIASIALAPVGGDGHASDGLQLLHVFAAPKERDLVLGVGTLASLSRYGTRPRDWPAELVRRYLWEGEPGDKPPHANLLAYWHALDLGDVRRARERLGIALAQVADASPAAQAPFFVEAAYVAGVFDYDTERARAHMEQVPSSAVEEHSDRRGLAAVAYAARDYPRARGAAEAALEAIPKSQELGWREAERDLIKDILDRCDRLA